MGKPLRSARRKRGVSRRDFLRRASGASAAFAATPFLAACGGSDSNPPAPDGGDPPAGGPQTTPAFRHGVASGDPLPDRVVFWTRVTPEAAGPVPVQLVVASDPELKQVVAQGAMTTGPERDYTVKIDQAGLAPATTYYYRFTALGQQSPIGRSRTAPASGGERLRIGVVSCSSYAHGVFNAYRRLAERADIDVVLHLGDYIYEYATGSYGNARPYEPAHEIVTLQDYRMRHAQYKRDADLQEVHRQHPFVTVWDDHESANDAWRDGAENHSEASEGAWPQRKAWAAQAYAEWMPIRLPDPNDPLRIYRRFRYGDLVELVMLDTRLAGRDAQAGREDTATLDDEARELLGPQQRDFLTQALSETQARWKLLGQQVMFGQLRIPSLPELSRLSGLPAPQLQEALGSLPVVATGGVVVNADQWDGYRAERRRLFDLIDTLQLDNLVVLTGDIHTSWAMDLSRDPGNPLVYNPVTGSGSRAVELVTPSVTSPGLEALTRAQDAIRLLNPHIKYVDWAKKGYLLLDITPERLQGEWWYVDTIATASSQESFGKAFLAQQGSNRLQQAAAASEPRATAPVLAP